MMTTYKKPFLIIPQAWWCVSAETLNRVTLLVLLAFPQMSVGDSWAAAVVTEVLSPDTEHRVRIVPGNSLGDTFGFAGQDVGEYAHAIYYHRNGSDQYTKSREITLGNPVAPVDAYLTNEGYLVTLDNWHNMGYGEVVVIYDAAGELVASYELNELYKEDEALQLLERSASSIWWRCGNPQFQLSSFSVNESNGGRFEFQFSSGDFSYVPGESECE